MLLFSTVSSRLIGTEFQARLEFVGEERGLTEGVGFVWMLLLCRCGYPLVLDLLLTAPSFSNLDEAALDLEKDLAASLNILPNQTFASNMIYQPGAIIEATVWVFPETGNRLAKSTSSRITTALRHHEFNLPEGPYLLLDSNTSGLRSAPFPLALVFSCESRFLPIGVEIKVHLPPLQFCDGDEKELIILPGFQLLAGNRNKSKLSTGAIIGIAVGATAGVLIVAFSIVFAVVQKKRADKAVMSNPFGTRAPHTHQIVFLAFFTDV